MTKRILTLALLTIALSKAVVAQTQTPSADQVVKLADFTVSEKSPNGYIASETMTGSRVNTKIIDLPYSIVNLTSEFFDDFNIQILDENMTYIGGLTGVGIGGSFNLRGFSASSQLRDGFYRLGRYGLSNVDRLEVIRGPNAAIYGRSSPGGMINMISLQPKKQDSQTVSISRGSYFQKKDQIKATGSIDKDSKTYYVTSFALTDRHFPGQFGAVHNQEYYAAIAHDFSDSSRLQFSAEYFMQIQQAPQGAVPLVSAARTATSDNTATTQALGYDLGLGKINPYGPNSELDRGSVTFTGVYEKQFNDIWSLRVGAYNFRARRWDFNSNTSWGAITIPATGAITSTRGSIPSRGEIQEDGGGYQQDLKAHYWLKNHTIEANTLFTIDYNDYYRYDPTWEYGPSTDPALVAWGATGSGRVVSLTSADGNPLNLIPTAPINYFPNWYNTQNLALFSGSGNAVTGGAALNGGTLTRRRTTSIGGNLRQQMFLLNGKLIVYAGVRNDTVLFSQRDYTAAFASVGFGNTLAPGTGGANQPGGSVVRRYEHQNKPNTGFNYQITPNLHFYGSYSTAYFVDQTSRPAVIAASTYAPFTAKGYDYGIKGSYLNSRLNFTVGGYYAKQFNVLVTDTVETPPGSGLFTNVTLQDGDQLVRGFEFDLSWVVNENVIAGVSGAEVNSKYTNYGSAYPEVIGRSVNGITPENGSAYIKYIVPGVKGLYLNALTTYVSSTPSQVPNTGDTTAIDKTSGKSYLTGHTDAWKIRYPSYETWVFSANYRLPRLNRGWDQRLSLTLNNAFNKNYVKTNGLQGDGRGIMLSYSLTHGGSH